VAVPHTRRRSSGASFLPILNRCRSWGSSWGTSLLGWVPSSSHTFQSVRPSGRSPTPFRGQPPLRNTSGPGRAALTMSIPPDGRGIGLAAANPGHPCWNWLGSRTTSARQGQRQCSQHCFRPSGHAPQGKTCGLPHWPWGYAPLQFVSPTPRGESRSTSHPVSPGSQEKGPLQAD